MARAALSAALSNGTVNVAPSQVPLFNGTSDTWLLNNPVVTRAREVVRSGTRTGPDSEGPGVAGAADVAGQRWADGGSSLGAAARSHRSNPSGS